MIMDADSDFERVAAIVGIIYLLAILIWTFT